jgi:tetratricopeptide (TPR) repeat protein
MYSRWYSLVACFCLFCVLFLFCSPVLADGWPVPRGPSREPEPYRFDPQHLKKAPREILDDASACMIYFCTTYRLEPDGTVETTTHEVTRLNGRKGIASLGEYRGITFDPAYQKLTLNEARVLKAGGEVVPIQPRHVQLRDVGTDYEIYEPEKELVISFPNLKVGDVYEVKWTTRGRHPENAGHFFTRYNFGSTNYPMLRDEMRVILPADKELCFATVNGRVRPVIHRDGKQCTYSWKVANEPALPRDNDLPAREELRLQVMCSTFPSWEAIGRWKQQLRAGCWECTPALRKVVLEVTRGLSKPVDKARALTYWVRHHIRYVSIVSASHRYTPSLPATVHGNLYGDCKDQVQLLAVLLREAGLQPELVTLGVRGDGQVLAEVPSPWGTHALLLVRIDGKDHWIDTTAALAAWDYLPRNDCDRVVYITPPDGRLRLARTPKQTWADNRVEQTTLVTVAPDGSAVCNRISRDFGAAALDRREDWLDTPAGECRRQVAAALQDANSRTKLLRLDLEAANLRDLEAPVCAIMRFEIPGQFRGTVEREAGFTDSRVWSGILAYNFDHERTLPLELYAPFESVHHYDVQLPPAFRFVTTNFRKEARAPWGFVKVELKRDPANDRRVVLEFHTRLENTRIAPADFEKFRAFQHDVDRIWRAWVTIAPATALADAPALEKAVAQTPGDRSSATVLARLYLRHSRLEEARRVLNGIKQLAPEDTELWELAVQAAPTLGEEETLYREMIARFPGRADYVVALGTTLIERGQHDVAEKVLLPLAEHPSVLVRGQAGYQLARSALGQHHPVQALNYFQAARQASSEAVENVQAWELLAQVQAQLGQTGAARDALRRAWQLKPEAKSVLAALVRLELEAKHPRQALEWLRRFTLAVKGDVEGLVQAAQFHLRLDRLDDALDLALQSRDLDFHADAQKVIGLVSLRKGLPSKAVFHLDRANRDADVLLGLVQAHLALGNLTQATECAVDAGKTAAPPASLQQALRELRQLRQRHTELLAVANVPAGKNRVYARAADLLVCAERAHRSGQPTTEVEKLLKQSLAAAELAPAFALRGLLALRRGQLRAALADADKALQLHATEAQAWYIRGRVHLERGDGEALKELQRAADLCRAPDADVLHWLAAAQFDAGLRREALVNQRRAVQLRPGDEELTEQLRRFEAALDGE